MSDIVLDKRSSLAKAIKGDVYSSLREALTKPIGKAKHSYFQEFIKDMLSEAKKNPNGPIGQWLTKQILQDGILEKLDAETDKYLSRDIDFLKFRLLNTLYKEQRDVFLDHYRNKLVICSRRVGKTELAARLLLSDMAYPNHHAVFIATKFENAIRQCFVLVENLAKALGMNVIKASKSEGEIAFSNGSNILFKGNSTKAEADKLLGYKFSYAIIDESQNQVNLMYLIDTVLRPALTDYEDSKIVLLGTPPRAPKTSLEDIWNNYKDWYKYTWDMSKNPYLPNVEEYIEGICRDKGITKDAPFIQREMFGIWAYDTEAQVFKDYKTYESTTEVPKNITNVYIGIDFGWTDYNAIVGIASNNVDKKAYIFAERKFNHANVTEIVNATRDVFEQGKKIIIANNGNLDNIAIYGDTSDQSIIYEMSQTHGFPAYPCYKYDKANAIEQLAEYCRTGKILNIKGGILEDEFQRTLYKRDDQDNILAEIDDDNFHPDAIFALLYASRQLHFDWSN